MDWTQILGADIALAAALEKLTITDNTGASSTLFRFETGGVVLKIGRIDPGEVQRQRWVRETLGLALPVLGYRQGAPIPFAISKAACPRHRTQIDGLDDYHLHCFCGDDLDILVMPIAEVSPASWSYYATAEGQAVVGRVADALWETFKAGYDDRPANGAFYNGKYVLLDFGEPI